MKKIVLTTLLATFAVCNTANAYTVRGIGGSSCREFNNGANWVSNVNWVLGFISGSESLTKPDILSGTGEIANNSTVIDAVAEYCRAHPQKDIAEAAAAVAHYLNSRVR